MADPAVYIPGYSFANFQANAPTTPLPGPRVDTELANVSAAVAALVSSIRDVRRSDGTLKNGIVTLDSLGVGVLVGMANLNTTAASLLDASVAAIQTNVNASIAALAASKADLVHTQAATTVNVSAISGIVGTTVQAVLAELRALCPQTGDYLLSMSSAARSGWLLCDDGTISNATGAGTTFASALAWPLYNVLYTEISDAYAPVTGGRGANALADFNALKPIALTKLLGRALAVAGTGAGGLSARVNGQAVGAETVTLDATMMPSHTHTAAQAPHTHTGAVVFAGGTTSFAPGGAQGLTTGNTGNAQPAITVDPIGGGLAHTNMQPTTFLKAFLKL